MATLRQTLPRASLAFHSQQLQRRLFCLSNRRHAQSPPPPPPKPRVLAKPERFNPPSHPSRLRSRPRQYPGPPLSEHERQAQKTRRYPNMMPGEDTFMHWFLTNRLLHAYFAVAILISLVFGNWYMDFIYTTPYADLLPPNSLFLAHPFSFIGRYWEVYRMHVAYVTAETNERRRRKVEDVAKRSEYRKAHGLDQDTGFFSWTAKSDAEVLGPTMREGGGKGEIYSAVAPETIELPKEAPTLRTEGNADRGDGYVDFDGQTQPARKKWFGLW